ncbi:MAG: hypothetical protein M3Q23_17325 [Actinomycetota bacterium]|nr:hypothetical protein [Actinomycetota bacterium]
MRRTQMSKQHSRRDDPAPVLALDPRDPDVLRAKRLRARAEAAKQSR